MGLNVTIHEDRVEATAGPVASKDRQKLEREHEKIVGEMRATVPHLDVSASVSKDELTRFFTVSPVTSDTRMNVGAMAEASHQRLDATDLEWGGPG